MAKKKKGDKMIWHEREIREEKRERKKRSSRTH
jgi:hypothetical protein